MKDQQTGINTTDAKKIINSKTQLSEDKQKTENKATNNGEHNRKDRGNTGTRLPELEDKITHGHTSFNHGANRGEKHKFSIPSGLFLHSAPTSDRGSADNNPACPTSDPSKLGSPRQEITKRRT